MSRVFVLAVVVLALTATGAAADAGSGLVGHWRLDEGTGTRAADSSGYANNGTVLGGAAWVPGRFGTALSFDTGRVQVPNSPSLEPAAAVSVSAWINQAGSPGDYRYILAKGATGCIAASYGLYSGPNGGLEFYVSKQRGTTYARSPDAGARVWDGKWHLVVGTFDGTSIRLFVDGSEVGSGTSYPGQLEYLLPDSNDLYIGDYPGCQVHNFLGVIDDVMVWNRALAPAEVTALAPQPGESSLPAGGQTPTSTGQPGNGSGGEPGAQPGASGDPPALGLLRIAPSAFAISFGGRLAATRRRTGATISYTDTQPARSTFVIVLPQPGVLIGARCVKPSRRSHSAHKLRCTRYVAIGSFTHADRAGRNRFRFTGLRGRRLAPGSYRLYATPTAHGKIGRTMSAAFKLIRS